MSAFLDYSVSDSDAGYTGSEDDTGTSWGMLPGDVYDSAHMAPVQQVYNTVNGQQSSQPWWSQAIQYGLVRAIDNRFGPTNVAGNVNPGTFAGYNGRTYSNVPGQPGYVAGGLMGGMDPMLMLLLIGGVAFLALKA